MKVEYDKTTKMIEVTNEETIDMPKVLYFDFDTFTSLVHSGINLLEKMEGEAWEAWINADEDIDFGIFERQYYK